MFVRVIVISVMDRQSTQIKTGIIDVNINSCQVPLSKHIHVLVPVKVKLNKSSLSRYVLPL